MRFRNVPVCIPTLERGNEQKVPAHKMGLVWRFDATELGEWLKSGRFGYPNEE